jgi:chemotaxis protein MotA
MDFASFIGIIAGFALITWSIMLGGDIGEFYNVQGIMVVIGGTVSATLLTFRFGDTWAAFRAAWYVFRSRKEDPNDTVASMLELSDLSRKKGLIALSTVETESGFLKKGCNLIADGTPEEVIQASLRIEIDALKARHHNVQDVFKKMAAYAPAFGMIGTLIGLVQMLANISDPQKIGPAMAVALLTTFYGSILANLVFTPCAGKLKSRTLLEVMNLEIVFEGSASILDNNNPLTVYERLSSYIPAKKRKPLKRSGQEQE